MLTAALVVAAALAAEPFKLYDPFGCATQAKSLVEFGIVARYKFIGQPPEFSADAKLIQIDGDRAWVNLSGHSQLVILDGWEEYELVPGGMVVMGAEGTGTNPKTCSTSCGEGYWCCGWTDEAGAHCECRNTGSDLDCTSGGIGSTACSVGL